MRKLASIKIIEEIRPIPDADRIVSYRIGGWWVVDQKDRYNIGDLVVYFEIDSWIPYSLAPFLSKDKDPKEYNGILGERLRTIRLKKQLSQGLILPITIPQLEVYEDGVLLNSEDLYQVNEDVTDILGIVRYEPPISAELSGLTKGNFPSIIPKTDEERIQNLSYELSEWNKTLFDWEITEKLDGSSMTVYFHNGEFGVCSRNLELKESDTNTFWKVARHYDLRSKLNCNIAIQGELVGEGIQGNKYKLVGHDFYVFNIFDIDKQEYLSSNHRLKLCDELGLKHVPVLGFTTLADTTIDLLLSFAEDKSKLNSNTEREGVVIKQLSDPSKHFKAISNKFLLKGGE